MGSRGVLGSPLVGALPRDPRAGTAAQAQAERTAGVDIAGVGSSEECTAELGSGGQGAAGVRVPGKDSQKAGRVALVREVALLRVQAWPGSLRGSQVGEFGVASRWSRSWELPKVSMVRKPYESLTMLTILINLFRHCLQCSLKEQVAPECSQRSNPGASRELHTFPGGLLLGNVGGDALRI